MKKFTIPTFLKYSYINLFLSIHHDYRYDNQIFKKKQIQ